MSGEPISLEGVRMHVAERAPGGVVNEDTIFAFRQEGDLVEASYAGGRIRKGYLVGRLEGASLEFRYCQVQDNGQIDGGVSRGTLSRESSGKIRLDERFEWASRDGEGRNVMRELA